MWNKIYLLVLAVAVLLSIALTAYTYSWLESVTRPADVAASFESYSNFAWLFLWISTLILLFIANVVLWTRRKAWALWLSFLYFVVFIGLQKFWLEQAFFQYKRTHNLTESTFFLSPLFAVLLIFLMAVIVFFNQFIIKRLQERTSPQPLPSDTLPEEFNTEKNKI